MALFSVFGADGFIGAHLCSHLRRQGHEVRAIGRSTMPKPGAQLGHVIYCIGLTADFRTRPAATARAHVGVLADVFEIGGFDSLLYLSSTRVYAGAAHGREQEAISVQPGDPDQLYNLTKLAGEALCLAFDHPAVRVARLSNVVGPGTDPSNFLASVIVEAIRSGVVVLRTAADSAKDYIDVDDVTPALTAIAQRGRHRLYNIASGVPTSNATVAALIERELGARVRYAADAPVVRFPRIDIGRLRQELDFIPIPFERSFRRLADAAAILVRTS